MGPREPVSVAEMAICETKSQGTLRLNRLMRLGETSAGAQSVGDRLKEKG
jgi:hypothetical protein